MNRVDFTNMEAAAAASIFPALRATPEHAEVFRRMLSQYNVPLEHVLSIGQEGEHWFECDSVVDLTKWRCVFSEIEYSTVDPTLMAQAIEVMPETYGHPTIFPMTTVDPRAVKVEIPVSNLAFDSDEAMLESLAGRYRYVVRKSQALPFDVEVKQGLTEAEIRWALGNIGERFYNDHMTFVMVTVMWAAARNNTFVLLRDYAGGPLQAIAGFQDVAEHRCLRFGAFVSAFGARSNVGVRSLWEACLWGDRKSVV